MKAEKPREIVFEGKSPGKRKFMTSEKPREIVFEGKSPGKRKFMTSEKPHRIHFRRLTAEQHNRIVDLKKDKEIARINKMYDKDIHTWESREAKFENEISRLKEDKNNLIDLLKMGNKTIKSLKAELNSNSRDFWKAEAERLKKEKSQLREKA